MIRVVAPAEPDIERWPRTLRQAFPEAICPRLARPSLLTRLLRALTRRN